MEPEAEEAVQATDNIGKSCTQSMTCWIITGAGLSKEPFHLRRSQEIIPSIFTTPPYDCYWEYRPTPGLFPLLIIMYVIV